MFETPILFLVFNRPDTTQQVFNKIRQIQPTQLFVAADGPRPGKTGEKEKTEQVRKIILDGIDWDCEVKTLLREANLGCGKAVSRGISWFFDNIEQGIILEDDTIPDLSFFYFCQELLNYYKHNDQVMHISGTNGNLDKIVGKADYYFSRMAGIWGWATWRNAWERYDFEMQSFPDFKESRHVYNIFPYTELADLQIRKFSDGYQNNIDTWDYQWQYTITANNGLSITPNKNLVKNVGFNEDATHSKVAHRLYEQVKMESLDISSLKKTKFIIPDNQADWHSYLKWYKPSPEPILNKIKNTIPQPLKNIFKKILFIKNEPKA